MGFPSLRRGFDSLHPLQPIKSNLPYFIGVSRPCSPVNQERVKKQRGQNPEHSGKFGSVSPEVFPEVSSPPVPGLGG